ncbi:MAG: site-specific DNA-methyltransferase [Lachnospiraceae bacterium]|jgi:site-specific DNA-methyltransferase (adenine-specific)|nr:site-specific DNA-methyltransferase [Lachnospiraceae bacterium]MCI8997106.1 site-specific DNA-methyltransferase [Lachnospiraceae bacterium]MCI9135515.1 site-specific DNA-methyltransferase [Lachnospiraceae bacterium]
MMEQYINQIFNRDCLEGMVEMPDHSVDLVIADPPYNLSKGAEWKWDNSVILKGMGGNWNKVMADWDNMSFEDYWSFTVQWISEVKRILKPTGSLWIFGTYHNMGIINVICQMLQVEIINEIIWFKRNAFPNLSGRRFTASHETILWAHSGGKKRQYYYDYEYIKNADFPEDQIKQPGKQMRTVWDIPNNKTKEELAYGKHPTQKPIRLLKRMILATTREGDLVFTPFSGSGSECAAAKICGRNYCGFELEEEYYQISLERLKHCERELSGQPLSGKGGSKEREH